MQKFKVSAATEFSVAPDLQPVIAAGAIDQSGSDPAQRNTAMMPPTSKATTTDTKVTVML